MPPQAMAKVRVPRRATRAEAQAAGRETRPLAGWRELDAYVLLGDPGAGKSWALEDECEETSGLWLEARNVVAGITPADLAGRTVFIDGLDEVRAGAVDGQVPFGAIRKWLHDHGNPRFRLSCREADWLGSSDTERLRQVAPGGQVTELHLDPLSDADIDTLLAARSGEVADAAAFLEQTRQAGLGELLRNPLLLDLTIKTAVGGALPRTRTGIYEAACRQLAREHNTGHLEAKQPAVADLHQAGKLCALLLLSGRRGVVQAGQDAADAVVLSDLPAPWREAGAALGSKVFTTDGGVQKPRHRSIAEFLAGQALAQRINEGMPVGRVLALMQGADGFPVEPLRGLWAWLAVHHAPSRKRMIAIDPLGFVLNGDAAMLSTDERVHVLHALRDAAEKDPWFRNATWISHPFGPLATADMATTYETLLRDPQRSRGHGSFMECVFDALRHGEGMPSLGPALEAWVEDASAASHLRVAAYEAWKRCTGFSPGRALDWLRAIAAGALPDGADQLLGALLTDLYPEHLTPGQVFDYWHPVKQRNRLGSHRRFWRHALWKQTPPGQFAELVEGWLGRQPTVLPEDDDVYELTELLKELLGRALDAVGDQVSDDTLYRWLGLLLDKHGFSRLKDMDHPIRAWLAVRPDRMKAVTAIALARATSDEDRWQAEARLHGTPHPPDWYFWLLENASSAHTPEVAQFCLVTTALAVVAPGPGLNSPSMEQIEAWVDSHRERWPDAKRWLQDAMPLDHPASRSARRKRQAEAQQVERNEARRLTLAPHIPTLLDGTAAAGLLHRVALAHDEGFADTHGETPVQRVRNYLVSDEATAQAVIDAMPLVLTRSDLPTVDEAIALEAKGKQHYIRPAALLAARLVHEHDAQAPLGWPRELAERLVAYYLTDGSDQMPGWYRVLAQHRPEWVAPVLVQYALAKFKRKNSQIYAGLWALGGEADHAALARLAVPQLLQAFPLRASEGARRILNRALLRALSVLDPAQAAGIVRMKLRQPTMDPAQRICWLVADLPHRAESTQELAALVGRNERRSVVLGVAMDEQDVLARVVQRLPPPAIRHLIEVLAPITTAKDHWHRSGDAHHRGYTVRKLLSVLSADPGTAARDALRELAQTPALNAWRDLIQYSLRTQAATAREASFHAPDPVTLALALDDLQPANPTDLRALVMQHLQDLQAHWRGRDTFALKEFWREPGHQPRIENDCRDLLADRLRERLGPLNILVATEQRAAQDKRADIGVEFIRDGRRIALPIEVKKEDHDKLWTAMLDQLQRLYAIDPDAQSCGLYLVLWFGVRTKPHPEGRKPRDAAELRDALETRIPTAERHRLAVQVLDLSRPTPDAAARTVRP